MTTGDNFPELPIPINSRRVVLGIRDLDAQKNYHRVVWLHMADSMPLEEIADRIVLCMKLLNGMTIEQLREAMNGSNLKIYYEVNDG